MTRPLPAPTHVAALILLLATTLLATPAQAQPREFLPGSFTVDQTIGTGRIELMRPKFLSTTTAGAIVVIDEDRVRAFGSDGRELWHFGRTGAYQHSLRLPVSPRELAVPPDGRFVTLEADLLPVIRVWSLRPQQRQQN